MGSKTKIEPWSLGGSSGTMAQSDIETRLKMQSIIKRHMSKAYSAQKDKRQKKSVISKVKNRLQNQGRHRMRWKIKKMQRERNFPQMPGKRDKHRQYGFIPKIIINPSTDKDAQKDIKDPSSVNKSV